MGSHTMFWTALVALACVCSLVYGHGGHLHEWPSTPVGRNYNRVPVATCNKWVAVKPAKSPAKSLVEANAAPVTVPTAAAGTATLWNYQYKNCSGVPSAGVDVFINLTEAAGKPAGGIVTDGTVHTESCAAGGGKPFYFNDTMEPIDDAHNMLWWHNFTVPTTNGSIRGNGANDGGILTSGPKAVKSIIISNFADKSPLFCCDLVYSGPATTNWTAKLDNMGVACDDDGNPLNAIDASATAAAAPAADAAAAAPIPSPAANPRSGAAAVQAASWTLLACAAVLLAGVGLFQ